MMGEHYELNGKTYVLVPEDKTGKCDGCVFDGIKEELVHTDECRAIRRNTDAVCMNFDCIFKAVSSEPVACPVSVRDVLSKADAGDVFTKLAQLANRRKLVADSSASAAKLEEELKEYL